MAWDEQLAREIGARIKAARNARGWSLTQVAERMGVSKGTAGHWETGARTVKIEDLHALCEHLRESADYLLFGRRQWPFAAIALEAVQALEPQEVMQIEGAIGLVSAQMGLDLRAKPPRRQSSEPSLAADRLTPAPKPPNVVAALSSPPDKLSVKPSQAEPGPPGSSPAPRAGRGKRAAIAPPPKPR